ncbi:MAG: SulP family inorganic anion transporter [Candidatus Saccharimonas sp.]
MYKHFKKTALKRHVSHVRRDLIAALVVTAIAIPQSLGFAIIVGLPPITGLYTALVAPIVFGLLARTRRLVVGPDSATAALVASGAMLVAQAGSVGYAGVVALLTLLVAVVLLIMAALRLGLLADLISRPVLVGFIAGVGVQLMARNFPGILGVSAEGSVWDYLIAPFMHLGNINGMTATISLLVIGVMLILRKTRLPGELIGLVLAALFVIVFQAGNYGVQLVGALPGGFPAITGIDLSLATIGSLLPAAIAIALVILAQSSSLIRTTAAEHDEPVSLNRDLFALGSANIVSSFTQGFAVNGSPVRTMAAESAGGRTSMVNVWMGIFIGIILLFGTQLFAYIPQAALASIVFVLGYRLIKFGEFAHVWRVHPTEFLVAMIALIGTAVFGVMLGVCVAVVVSLTERLIRQYHPKDSILLRDGELSPWAEERLGVGRAVPKDLLVYSFNGSLFFENIHYFTQRLSQAVASTKNPVRMVVIDAGAIDSIDYTAVGVLESFCRHLSSDGVTLGFAHVSPNLADQFERYGIKTLVGENNIYMTLGGAIRAHSLEKLSIADQVKRLEIAKKDYVLVGSGVLDVLGLREAADVDLVVTAAVYEAYRAKHGWHEFTQANGKKVLSHEGCNLMTVWVGNQLKQLRQGTSTVAGVRVMSIERLIDGKLQLGRRKDFADVKLLRQYLRAQKHITEPVSS